MSGQGGVAGGGCWVWYLVLRGDHLGPPCVLAMGLTEALLCQWYGATNWAGLWYQCYLPFFGFLLQSLLHIHSVILYFTHNPSSCPTTSSRKAFLPDHFHYVSLVVAIVCCHCHPTLFFPIKGTELNEMLHFQFQFLWLFLPAIGIQLSSLSYIKEIFNICYFFSVKILMCGNQASVWSF